MNSSPARIITISNHLVGAYGGMSFIMAMGNLETYFNKRTTINLLQLSVSGLSFLIITLFGIMPLISSHGCNLFFICISCFYAIFQVIAMGLTAARCLVFISRSKYYNVIFGGVMLATLICSLITIGSATNAIHIVIPESTCMAALQPKWNNISRIGLSIIYAVLLFCLNIPVRRHIVFLSEISSSSQLISKIESTARWLTIKVSLAMLAYLIIGILSIFGFFANAPFIPYSTRIYFTMLASNWVCVLTSFNGTRSNESSVRSSIVHSVNASPTVVPITYSIYNRLKINLIGVFHRW
ncbi:hypothetical protein BATDEDRAFT_28189 [Batrachochytrium dendrobatidis JAM81]|uniref:Uncharacterized protein n=1 Tax=Batrachochytrium dendrobatidis (strain JAM81 / FGSC 10211) TaxID=684364 RepID=F4PD86_BATDJ|nr:uncharacterized protein BATDEDRAFT_28189 [Batrachochytrium dendrobatidis JAM81]EGF76747.1 hypothetical protein BATDEDRAFT_28189 [Batrachochytrium dendrobatidis JAM81]|eukprot:XP_006682587.1 hypothetical protein BATDEDRAFT_28189 [Batrachochytrium dendrobatidis JAM81]